MTLDAGIRAFETSPHITPWYPPPSLSLTLLLVFGQRYAPVIMVGALLDGLCWRPLPLNFEQIFIFALIQTLGYSVTCFVLQHNLRIDLCLRRLGDMLWFLTIGTLIAPFVIGLLSVTNFAVAGLVPWNKYSESVFNFWLGDAIGITMLAPFLLLQLRPYLESLLKQKPIPNWSSPTWELLAQGVSILLGLYIAFGSIQERSLNFYYVSFLPIVWTAVRQGLARTTVAILVTNVGATILLRVQGGNGFDLAVFQFYLLAVSQTGLVLGAVVSERQRAENNLRIAQSRLQHFITSGPAVIYSSKCSGDYGITFISENVSSLLGYKAEEFVADSSFWIQRVHPEDIGRVLIEFDGILWLQRQHTCEYRFLHQDGSYRWIQDQLKLVNKKKGQFELLGCWQDITERKSAEAELYKREKLLRGVAEATNYLLTDPDFGAATAKALKTLGIAAEVDRVYICENHPHPITGEIAISTRFEWTEKSTKPTIDKIYWQNQPYSSYGMSRWHTAFKMGQVVSGVVREFPASEQEILSWDNIVSVQMVPIIIDAQLWGYVGFDDCHSERRWTQSEESILVAMAASIGGALKRQRIEAQLVHNAFHDPLTGLPNRALFIKRMEEVLHRKQRQDGIVAILFLDLDQFKLVNDSLGHLVGDQLLLSIARKLRSCVGEKDTIARLGGDEFTILLEIQSVNDAIAVAEHIQQELIEPFIINGYEVFTNISIGISLSTTEYQKPEDLLRDADTAMYRAKFLGRSRYEVFDSTMHTYAVSRLQLETDLRRSLERQEFCLHYQPIVSLATNKTVGFEALVRWQHPERGLVFPSEFITVAEETGLILPLGHWVLLEACRQLRCWQIKFPLNPPLTLSVNFSVKQLTPPDLVERVKQVLLQTGLSAESLKLEITESVIIENAASEKVVKLMQLKALGLQFSLDDFGTGYSSLNYLHRFPINMLKIDRSFVTNINVNYESLELIKTIITLARNLNIDVTAEGVELPEQSTLLQELGCQFGQGYLFSKPVDSQRAEALLSQEFS